MASLSRTQCVESHEMKIRNKYMVSAMVILLSLVFFYVDYHGDESPGSMPSSVNFVDLSTNYPSEHLNNLKDVDLLETIKEVDSYRVEEMMRKSRDYRVLYEDLVRSGSPKARFYAQDILGRCFSIRRRGLHEVVAVSTQQESARMLQQERCGSFSSEEVSFDALRQVGVDPRFSVGLAEIKEEWSKAGSDKTRQKQVFEQVLQANDALLLQYIGAGLLSQQRESIRWGDVEFNGESALDSMRLAWMAAVCEGTGTDCGAGDAYVVDACASLNLCEESRRLALRALVARKHGQIQQSNFDTAHALFVKAIQSRNVQIFFPETTP